MGEYKTTRLNGDDTLEADIQAIEVQGTRGTTLAVNYVDGDNTPVTYDVEKESVQSDRSIETATDADYVLIYGRFVLTLTPQ